jgi:hypothetical protein
MMNYEKLGASLSQALSEQTLSEESRLTVSVRTVQPPTIEQQEEMKSFGIQGISSKGQIFSAQLSPGDVARLSERPWIRLLSLAQPLKPLKGYVKIDQA